MEIPRLFRTLEIALKSITTKSRDFNYEYTEFIQEKVRKLLTDNIIEPAFIFSLVSTSTRDVVGNRLFPESRLG